MIENNFNKYECYELIETWLKTFKGKPGSNNICILVDHIEKMFEEIIGEPINICPAGKERK